MTEEQILHKFLVNKTVEEEEYRENKNEIAVNQQEVH